jgi:hypothetical protein
MDIKLMASFGIRIVITWLRIFCFVLKETIADVIHVWRIAPLYLKEYKIAIRNDYDAYLHKTYFNAEHLIKMKSLSLAYILFIRKLFK